MLQCTEAFADEKGMARLRPAFDALGQADGRSLAAFLVVLILHKLANAWMQRAALPDGVDVSLSRLWMASEAHVGASNAVMGGAGVGFGLRAAMLRSWGVDGPTVGASLVICAAAPSMALWLVAAAHLVVRIVAGQASGFERWTAALAFGILGVQFGVGRAILSDGGVRLAGRALGFGQRVLVRRAPRVARRRVALSGDVDRWTHDVRDATITVLRRKGLRVVGSAALSQITLGLILLAGTRLVLSPNVSLDGLAVLRGFAVVRAFSSFVPLPNGVGVLDVGLVAVLVRAGVPAPTAAVAMGIYRLATFAAPVVSGMVCTAVWRARIAVIRPPSTTGTARPRGPAGSLANAATSVTS